VDCLGQPQTRPSSFILTCADAGDVLTALHWVNWASEAFGTGTKMINSWGARNPGRSGPGGIASVLTGPLLLLDVFLDGRERCPSAGRGEVRR
jgi:hypothetical protein